MFVFDQVVVLLISFVVFFLPSLLVFLYKIFYRKKGAKNKSFWAFLFSEYISIFIILGIMLFTIGGVKLAEKYHGPRTIKNLIQHAVNFGDYTTAENLYTDQLENDSLNLYKLHQKIYYHNLRSKIKLDQEGKIIGTRNDASIRKFFKKYLDSDDLQKQQIWFYYQFLSHYFDEEYSAAQEVFSKHQLGKLKYTNYYMGTYLWEDWRQSVNYYQQEIENDGFVQKSYQDLAYLYLAHDKTDEVKALINAPKSSPYISQRVESEWAFQTGQYLYFIKLKYRIAFEGITFPGFIIALIILAMWFLFFYKLDLFEKEKIHLLIFTVILSTLITNLCLLAYAFYDHHLNFYLAGVPQNDFLYSIFGIGLIEELTKLIPFLVIFLMFRKEFNEPFDYILFMVMAALGFAFEENMMYFYEGTTHTFSARAIYSSMGHMFFSATIAYGIVLAIYRYKNWYRYLVVLLFFLFSITAHGLYDYLIFFDHYYISVLFFLLITKVFIQYINNALNNSTYFDYKVNMQTYNLRQIIAIGISLVFAAEYIYTAWYYSVPKADDLAFDLYKYSCFFVMIYLADHFSHFNLVKGEWGVLKLDFNSFNIHREEENFIGRHVILSRTQKNNNLQEPFNQFPVKATIIDRTSVRYESIWLKKKDIKEHDWFILELETPLQTVNGLKSILLINFTAKAVNLFHKKESAMAMIVKDNKVLEDVNPKSHFILLGNINVANDN